VKGIGHESKRVGKETRDDLDEEKDSVDSDHDLDPGTLGPSHLLKNTHDEVDGLETEQKNEKKKVVCVDEDGKRRRGKKLEGIAMDYGLIWTALGWAGWVICGPPQGE
jgi:hypothetical protein